MLARIGNTTSVTFVKEEKIAPASRKKESSIVPSDTTCLKNYMSQKISGFSSHHGLYKHLTFRPF